MRSLTFDTNRHEPPVLQTVAVLEERLTLTEDKLRECLDNQAVILEQMQRQDESRNATRGAEGPAV